jgi:amino acid permease
MTDEDKQRAHFTESQKASAYFNMDDSYDPLVYENTPGNYVKIVGMLCVFYCFMGLHWWCQFELTVHETETSTAYNLLIFGFCVIVIGIMLIYGAGVNKKKVTHEFYMEKISAEKLRQAEEQAKAAQKAANEAAKARGIN